MFQKDLKILALDTSSALCSAALLVGASCSERALVAQQRHAELLLPMGQELLRAAQCRLGELDAIAFGAGPGGFTGLRIACGVAQGLAYGAKLPVVPVSSLLSLAAATHQRRVIAAVDARMGEIYHAAYERVEADDWRCVSAPRVCDPRDAPLVEGGGWFGAGSGFRAFGTELRARYASALHGVDAALEPRAAQVAALAERALQRGESVPAHLALPIYLRDKVALTHAEQAHLRGAIKA